MLIHTESKSILLQAPDPLVIRELIPKSKLIDHPHYNIALHHTLDATRILRNIGIEAPSPIRYHYDWPGRWKPFDHQIDMAEFQTLNRRAFNLSEPGTCKTAAALWATDWLMKQGVVDRTLVLCPLSVVERVWMKDIFDTLMHRKAGVVHGTREKRIQMLSYNLDFYILNHDGIKIKDVFDAVRKDPRINQIIVDEGDEFRNDCDRSKMLEKLVKARDDLRIWWMTGTPFPNGPEDAWTQCRIVAPARVPQYKGAWIRKTKFQVSTYKWVARPEAFELCYQAMQPAIRFTKAECLDLPPVMVYDRQAQLTKEQQHNLKLMLTEMRMEAKERQITAVNAADKIGKIRQLLLGSIKDPATDEYLEVPHKPRLEVLLEALKEAAAKAYVVVPYKGAIQALAREVSKHYSVGVLNGDVPTAERNRIIAAFKNTPDPHVLLCHPKVTSHGLNFVEADTLVCYGPIYSNAQFQQVIERFNRPGQTRHMRIIRIGAHPLEWAIYKAVDDKRDNQDNILKLYKNIVEGIKE